ncbi:MAG: DMT family transporter [Bacteroidota bacterium]|nr:DMT family transporter [Bacteroidota bacterium]
MKTSTLRSDLLLLLSAMIWGLAFVAQRVGMNYVGPFTFSGVRFLLGGLSLIPVLYLFPVSAPHIKAKPLSPFWQKWGGLLAGLLLFTGISLQQIGLQYTSAGKAGFLTGLYVVLVPVFGLVVRQKTGPGTWIGVLFAVCGMYFLSVTGNFEISKGDLLLIISTVFWAFHVLTIGWLSPHNHPIKLSIQQFLTAGVISLVIAFGVETVKLSTILQAGIPILYGGLFSVGVAFTLQVVVQKTALPAHAAIIMSLETVFAAIGGWLLLDEHLSVRALLGCLLMLCGMLFAQFNDRFFKISASQTI